MMTSLEYHESQFSEKNQSKKLIMRHIKLGGIHLLLLLIVFRFTDCNNELHSYFSQINLKCKKEND